MKVKILIVFLIIIFSVSAGFSLENARAITEFGIWNTELSGKADINNVRFDFKENGDFKNKNILSFGGEYRTGNVSSISFDYHKFDFSGTINTAINIGSIAYASGADLTLEQSVFEILGHRNLKKGARGFLELIYGAKLFSNELNARNTTGKSSEKYTFPLPQIGIAGEYKLHDHWKFIGEFYGISLLKGNSGAKSKTLETAVQYTFFKKHKDRKKYADWYARLGWRAEYLNGRDNNDEFTVDFEGVRLTLSAKI